jgi:hypothetical protein
MTDSKNLSLSQKWDLVKYFFTFVLMSGLIFFVPFFLISLIDFGSKSSESNNYFIYLIYWVALIFIIKYLDEFLEGFERFFSNFRKQLKGASLFEKAFWVLLICLFPLGLTLYPLITVAIWSMVLIPAAYTHDRYIAQKQGAAKHLTYL